MSRTVDTKADLQTLQNAMGQLSMLAASAPSFQAAIAAAREVLGAMSEAEKDLDRVYAERTTALTTLNGLNRDIEERGLARTAAEAAAALAVSKAAALDEEYRAARDRFDGELEQHRVSEVQRVRREIAGAEEYAESRKSALLDVVTQLEKRKTEAEEALRALKERL